MDQCGYDFVIMVRVRGMGAFVRDLILEKRGSFENIREHNIREALELYKSWEASEKLFRGDKSYLGNKSLRVQSDEAAGAKIMIEFIALIVRCRIYTLLKDEMRV